MSDALIKSPTTTERDVAMASQLEKIWALSGDGFPFEIIRRTVKRCWRRARGPPCAMPNPLSALISNYMRAVEVDLAWRKWKWRVCFELSQRLPEISRTLEALCKSARIGEIAVLMVTDGAWRESFGISQGK